MRIAVYGAGYVGLVTAACLAHRGHTVQVVETDPDRLRSLRAGITPFHEPHLTEYVHEGLERGELSFHDALPLALMGPELVLVCVGTPPTASGAADLQMVGAAVAAARSQAPMAVICVKSTVPPGTCAALGVTHSPEFLREGRAVDDCLRPDRVVVGADVEADGDVVERAMQEAFGTNETLGPRLLRVSTRAAELAKYASNAMLAVRLALVNEIADLSAACGADAADVLRIVGADRRIGPAFLQPGPGAGGSCFPKDLLALLRTAQFYGQQMPVTRAAELAHAGRPMTLANRILMSIQTPSKRYKRIAILGRAFKSNTDDVRSSPAVALADKLGHLGAVVTWHDPVVAGGARSMLDAVRWADCVVLATEWPEYGTLDPAALASVMVVGHRPVAWDLRGLWSAEKFRAAGFAFYGIGVPDAPIEEEA